MARKQKTINIRKLARKDRADVITLEMQAKAAELFKRAGFKSVIMGPSTNRITVHGKGPNHEWKINSEVYSPLHSHGHSPTLETKKEKTQNDARPVWGPRIGSVFSCDAAKRTQNALLGNSQKDAYLPGQGDIACAAARHIQPKKCSRSSGSPSSGASASRRLPVDCTTSSPPPCGSTSPKKRCAASCATAS